MSDDSPPCCEGLDVATMTRIGAYLTVLEMKTLSVIVAA
jgi:hypothetical protein